MAFISKCPSLIFWYVAKGNLSFDDDILMFKAADYMSDNQVALSDYIFKIISYISTT